MTDRYQRFLASKWFACRKNPRLRERLMRLNKNTTEGELIRGWHPAPTLRSFWFERGVEGKRHFIAKYGRNAWDALPRRSIIKRGKRAYVTIEAVQDQAWLPRKPIAMHIPHKPPSMELVNMLEDLKQSAIKMMAVGELVA